MAFPLLFVQPFPGDPEGDGETTHMEAAVARLRQYLKGRPKIAAMLSGLAAQAQELEVAYKQLFNERSIDDGLGAQLDVLGEIIGRPREILTTDDLYRLWLRAWVLLNRSSGSPEELYAIFTLVASVGSTLELVEEFPAAFTLRIEGAAQTREIAAELCKLLGKAKAAGVRAILVWFESPPAEIFRFDSGPGLDQGKFAGGRLAR